MAEWDCQVGVVDYCRITMMGKVNAYVLLTLGQLRARNVEAYKRYTNIVGTRELALLGRSVSIDGWN